MYNYKQARNKTDYMKVVKNQHTTWVNSWNSVTTSENRSSTGLSSICFGHWEINRATGICNTQDINLIFYGIKLSGRKTLSVKPSGCFVHYKNTEKYLWHFATMVIVTCHNSICITYINKDIISRNKPVF